MSKYRQGLVKDIEAKHVFRQEQKNLKKKHHIEESEECIVVEKSNMAKFLIRTLAAMIRVTASICIGVLAVIGLVALLYPSPRGEMVVVWNDIWGQITQFLPL